MKGGQMELFVKHFSELSAQELFEIYKLRVSVFVVEQKCYYQEVDDADKTAYHVWLRDGDGIQAYVHVLLGKHADTGNVVRNQTAHAGDSAVLTSMYSAMRRS